MTFHLPDTLTALPLRPFEFSPAAHAAATTVLAQEPGSLYRTLLRDQESESTFLAARRILHAFLPAPAESGDLGAEVAAARDELAPIIDGLRANPDVLRERAPLALLGACWLEAVSQPATQPSIIVNRLYAQHFAQRGGGNPRHSVAARRRRALEDRGVYLPEIAAADFLDRARARPLTALHGCFYLALTRLPANFLPEVVGVQYAVHALGVDDRLCDLTPLLPEETLRGTLTEFLTMADSRARQRMHAAVRLVLDLEREHVGMLAELAAWRAGLSLESRVAEVIARHAPLAGRQHGAVRVGDRLLAEAFTDPNLDLGAFLAEFREASHVESTSDSGGSRFIQAMKFGGPMFGIFDEQEAATFREWVAAVQAGARPRIEISRNTVGDKETERWRAAITASAPQDTVMAEAKPRDDRELFHRLVNIENFANTLELARRTAERYLADAEVLFTHGANGRYTDATWFDYSPEALYERAERVYWDKLVNPYQPLTEIPDRDEVIFTQTTYLLGYLIDGAWLHRLGHLGHERESDAMLFAIYADEMGHGDLAKNHITLTHRVLASLGLELPHIRDAAFMDQGELPDDLYGFSVYQLCLCLHPDRFYNEIMGYNLAIEMFGSGELRLHEAQKLRHHGFDDCYETAHLAIDNFSAGHTRQAADIIVSYLDSVARTVGPQAVPAEWRRIWRGYASFAYFVEHQLLRDLDTAEEAELVI
jgi:hypothetical protein